MTRDEVRDIAREAADEAVLKTLIALGFNASDPEGIGKIQADLIHLRRWREATESVPKYAIKAAVTTLVAGLVGYLMIVWGWKPN